MGILLKDVYPHNWIKEGKNIQKSLICGNFCCLPAWELFFWYCFIAWRSWWRRHCLTKWRFQTWWRSWWRNYSGCCLKFLDKLLIAFKIFTSVLSYWEIIWGNSYLQRSKNAHSHILNSILTDVAWLEVLLSSILVVVDSVITISVGLKIFMTFLNREKTKWLLPWAARAGC